MTYKKYNTRTQKMDIEFLNATEIKKFQELLLAEQLRYLNSHSPFYKRMFQQHKLDINNIEKLEDLAQIPFTTKDDLLKFNNDFLCCPSNKIIDYVTTSGTLGEPVIFGCSENDLQRLAYNECKSFQCAGVTSNSIVQLMTTLDKRFMAGMAYFNGLRALGASIIRVGNGNPEMQWDTILRLKPDTIMCIPSFILKIIDFAEQNNIDYRNSSIRKIIGIGEGIRNQDFSLNLLGSQIHRRWNNVELYATYSSTEMSATFSECLYACGGHVHPELIIVEIISDSGEVLPDGECGEVVITTLGVQAMPLLRFKTGDIAAKINTKCHCGRSSFRLTPLLGRKNNMIKLKGTTLYPPAIFDVLNNIDYIENYIVEISNTPEGTDNVITKIGIKDNTKQTCKKNVLDDIKNKFRARLRVTPIIEILPTSEIYKLNFPAKSRKPVLLLDLRNNT